MSTEPRSRVDPDAAPDTDDMLMIHTSFRREFALAPRLVAAAGAHDRKRARRVADHLALVATSLHDHHAGEDAALWPQLRASGQVDSALLDDMLGEHQQLADDLVAVRSARHAWAERPGGPAEQELVAVLGRIHDEVVEHLDHEETHVLPLVRAHLTNRDWDKLADESRRRLPRSPRRQLLLLGILLEDATTAQRRQVEEQMPAPARWMWHTIGRRYYARYVRRLRRT